MCTFADVKAEDKLQLALIRIAQLEDELKAQTSRPDWTAREKELNDRHARELYDQKMFFREMMDEQKESHRIEMDNLRKALREENDRAIQRIEESHKREIESLKSQQAASADLQRREISHLNKGMAELKQQLKDAQLSEDEKGALALWELLRERDPESAGCIHPNNIRRVVRAFEMLAEGERILEKERKEKAIFLPKRDKQEPSDNDK